MANLLEDRKKAVKEFGIDKQYDISDEDIMALSPEEFDNFVDKNMILDLSADRLKLKNLNAPPEDALNYLKSKYPGEKFLLKDKNIFAVNQAGYEYPLDPEGFDIQDVTDIASDVAKGALSTGAGVLGGKVGGIGGAMAAAAAADAALNYGEQKLAQAAGVRKDVDPGEIALGATLSGATTGLFGSGLTKEAIKRGILAKSPGLAQESLKNTLEKKVLEIADKNRGLVSRLTPFVGSKVSTYKKDSIKYLMQNYPKVSQFATDYGKKSTALANEISERVLSKAEKFKASISNKFQPLLKSAGEKGVLVDISEIITDIDNEIAKTASDLASGKISKSLGEGRIKELNKMSADLLERNVGTIETAKLIPTPYDLLSETTKPRYRISQAKPSTQSISGITPEQAMTMKQQLKAFGKIDKELVGQDKAVLEGVALFARKLGSKLNNNLKKIDPELADSMNQYGDYLDVEKRIYKEFSAEDPTKVKNILTNLSDKFSSKGATIKEDLTKILDPEDLLAIEDASKLLTVSKDLFKESNKKFGGSVVQSVMGATTDPLTKLVSGVASGATSGKSKIGTSAQAQSAWRAFVNENIKEVGK